MTGSPRTAVVLFNLGGPDSLKAVRPFLRNLFSDPSILRVPMIFRWFLARAIADGRTETAREIYRKIGNRSPILENTKAQAEALEAALQNEAPLRVFVAMRYWHPAARETAADVAAFQPDRVVLLPLYPQWSTTTSASSVRVWREACRKVGLRVPTRLICCYPTEPGFVAAVAGLVRPAWHEAAEHGVPRVLFSAHGLPERVIQAGDPYAWQCEQTAAAIAKVIGVPDLDWRLCYQSRVGPLRWIGPATEDEVRRTGEQGRPLVLVPMAFVSEHSETLVELDIEYRELADQSGVPYFVRVATVGTEPAFIEGLAKLIRARMAGSVEAGPFDGCRSCPHGLNGCPIADELKQIV